LQSRVFRRHFLRLSRLSLLVSSWTRIPSMGVTHLVMMTEAQYDRRRFVDYPCARSFGNRRASRRDGDCRVTVSVRSHVRRHPRTTGVKENWDVLKAIRQRQNFDKQHGKTDFMNIGSTKAEWREFYGELGERAFEDFLKLRGAKYTRSLLIEEQTRSYDFVVDGARVDVKTTESDGIAVNIKQVNKLRGSDFIVAARLVSPRSLRQAEDGDDVTVEVVGFLSSASFLQIAGSAQPGRDDPKDPNRKEYRVHLTKFHPIEEWS